MVKLSGLQATDPKMNPKLHACLSWNTHAYTQIDADIHTRHVSTHTCAHTRQKKKICQKGNMSLKRGINLVRHTNGYKPCVLTGK